MNKCTTALHAIFLLQIEQFRRLDWWNWRISNSRHKSTERDEKKIENAKASSGKKKNIENKMCSLEHVKDLKMVGFISFTFISDFDGIGHLNKT